MCWVNITLYRLYKEETDVKIFKTLQFTALVREKNSTPARANYEVSIGIDISTRQALLSQCSSKVFRNT